MRQTLSFGIRGMPPIMLWLGMGVLYLICSAPAAYARKDTSHLYQNCPGLPRQYRLKEPPSPAKCIKMVYLNIPGCGGSEAMDLLGWRIAHVFNKNIMRSGNYEFEKFVEDEIKSPLGRSKLLLEIGTAEGAYRDIHKRILELQALWLRHGCKVALVTVYQDPETLTPEWQTLCSKAGSNRLPGFWDWAIHCKRENVMVNWLSTGRMCEHLQPATHVSEKTVEDALLMLRAYDIRGSIDNFPVVMARVWQFLELKPGRCIYRPPPNPSNKLTQRELSTKLEWAFCAADERGAVKVSQKAINEARNPRSRPLPADAIQGLIKYDKMLFDKLVEHQL